MPSNEQSNSSGSALFRGLLEALTRPITEEDRIEARKFLEEERLRPQVAPPTGGVIAVFPRLDVTSAAERSVPER